MKYLLDTNVVSEPVASTPNADGMGHIKAN
jgi:predicted nucleic acid-binding protein